MLTSGQSIWEKPRNSLTVGGIEAPISHNVPWVPESLHPIQNLDPFSRFCTAQARDRKTDIARNGIIGSNRPHRMHKIRFDSTDRVAAEESDAPAVSDVGAGCSDA